MEKSSNKTPKTGNLPFMGEERETGEGKLSRETMGKIKKEMRRKRRTYLAQFEIGDVAGLDILDRVIESYSRMREAEEIVKIEGLTTVNRFGEKKSHPAVDIERKSRIVFLSGLKQLNLDVLPPNHNIGRPGGK